MRRRGVVVVAAGAAVLLGAGCAQAAAGLAAGSWGRAITVPGLGALNKGGNAGVSSVSCASAGNCAAGGDYRDRHDHSQGFVAVERNGRWGRAIEVPGLGGLNKGRNVQVLSVSCASPGNCAVGGSYGARGEASGAGFVAVERNGRWGKAIEVPGLAALNKSDYAQVTWVSCGSAVSCAAGGFYSDGNEDMHAFVAAERNGRWGQAIEVPGLGALNKGEYAGVSSVSCASAGKCTAGGSYRDRHHHSQGFVAVEENGAWGKATAVPGLPNAGIDSISCPAPGTCAAGGSYRDRLHHDQGFVAVGENGVWGKATEVPGLTALNKGGNAIVGSVSCSSTGGCAAGGYYRDRHDHYQLFVAVERDGRRGKAIEVPGLAALNTGSDAEVLSVSCPPAGSCAAGGSYTDRRHHAQGFVVNQTR